MGSGCSTESSTDVRCSFVGLMDEKKESWRGRLLGDIGKDPTGVTRDFPRTQVYVAAPNRNNYYREKQDHVSVLVLKDKEDESKYFSDRNERVRESLELLVELCGEDSSVIKSEWEKQQKDIPDSSSLLMTVLLESGMMRATEANTENGGAGGETDAVTNIQNGGGGYAPKYTVHSKALRLMQYMVQSVAFFSTQHVTDALRFSWCKHMQDVSWAVYVYTEGGACGKERNSSDEILVLRHMHTLRHYVGQSERSTHPRFEVDWACTFHIDLKRLLDANNTAAKEATFAPEGEVQRIDGELLAARIESPNRKLCRITSTWKKRRSELEGRLMECFGVELTKVDVLDENGPLSALNSGG
ncbi:hypothetical protein, conserved [Trypanosoma brucei brucei TREU927]|uniref:Uncharacterized protein n=1 Tax=Trypanosoma brucei brucei (strain 927/4 GUTat10.1) TaxID=185431 RepID=Q57U03_TRYB2|nr:hypothetical protein, conserved [Trypanosoma brucei brucei TREU927]AAX70915.1 hypothetical protein, conserved [Trypanosoma brucei]AAZ12116.1 hypothetical protein, conserved [Trypanosoma brucei brucei TREU927]